MLNVTFYLPLCDIISAYGSDLCGTVDKICYINASVCSGIGVHDDNLIEKLVATQYFCGALLSDTQVNVVDDDNDNDYDDNVDDDDDDDKNVNGGGGCFDYDYPVVEAAITQTIHLMYDSILAVHFCISFTFFSLALALSISRFRFARREQSKN